MQANQLHVHDNNWGKLDHAPHAPQLISRNYYARVYVCMLSVHMYMYNVMIDIH